MQFVRQPQDVPKRPQPFPVPSPKPGDSRARPRRDCRPAGAGKGLLLTCLRVLGLTPPGYGLSLLPSRHMSGSTELEELSSPPRPKTCAIQRKTARTRCQHLLSSLGAFCLFETPRFLDTSR